MTYTLLVKASIEVIDLTDDVVRVGERPVGLGGFADVWKGVWTDRQDKGKKKLVSKFDDLTCIWQCHLINSFGILGST